MKRINTVPLKDITSTKTIDEVLQQKSVIVTETDIIRNIREYYNQFNLKEAEEDQNFFLYGFPINKSLNETIKSKLKNL